MGISSHTCVGLAQNAIETEIKWRLFERGRITRRPDASRYAEATLRRYIRSVRSHGKLDVLNERLRNFKLDGSYQARDFDVRRPRTLDGRKPQ